MPVSCYPDWESFKLASAIADGPADDGPADDGPADDGPVAFGGDLSPASVLSAYRCGIIPLPAADEYIRNINEFRYEDQVADGVIGLVGSTAADPYWVAWWSPDPRPVIRVSDVHLGRNVRKQLRRDGALWTTANEAFQRVAQECRAGREPRWLSDTLLETMIELHDQGWAHSIEVWHDDDLIGGAFGVGVGDVLSGDSMFSRQPDAARIAVADMAVRFAAAGGRLIDAQWDSPFLRSLGAGPVPRVQYLSLLAGSAGRRALPRQPLPARRLLPPDR